MFYTTEEAAIVCGFLDLYLNRDSVDRAVREQNRRFQRSAARGDLRREDYRWAEKALDFLQPCWWQSHEDHIFSNSRDDRHLVFSYLSPPCSENFEMDKISETVDLGSGSQDVTAAV